MTADRPPAFETIDWEAKRPDRSLSPRTVAVLAGGAGVALLYLYDRYVAHVYLVFDWKVTALDWWFLLSLVAFGTYVLEPAVRKPRLVARTWRRFRAHTEAVVGLGFLIVVFVAGLVGPILRPVEQNLLHTDHPPVLVSVDPYSVPTCAGPTYADRCWGSLQFPLGTDHLGRDVLALSLGGARVALYIAFITALIIVPLATAVGIVAAYRGGWLETVLMAGVDVQQTLPAIILYLFLVSVFSRELWLIILMFGLFSWGTVARLTHSETRQRTAAGYVLAARGMGASDTDIVRRHLVPNVSSTAVMAMAHLIPLLILTEAGIAFLGFTDLDLNSWGRLIADGLAPHWTPVWDQWWVAMPSVVLLAGTIVSCKIVGDALRDALDPRGER